MTTEFHNNLKGQLSALTIPAPEWSPPTIFDLSSDADAAALGELLGSGAVTSVRDELEVTAQELHMLRHPDKMTDEAHRSEFVADAMRQGERFGRWVYFPETGRLVHHPEEEDHYALRVFRNHNLVLPSEQADLRDVTTAHLGLSVGSIICEDVVRAGIGKKAILADKAVIKPTSLNRMRATFEDVGTRKTDYMGRVLSGIDPYLQQVHLPNGFSEDALDVLRANRPRIIFEETDDLRTKVLAREFARREKIALMMVTDLGHTALIDFEPYDKENVIPFGGRLKYADYQRILKGELTPAETQRYMVQIVGARYLTTRMLSSAMEVGKTLGGLPQLGDTASLGGAMAVKMTRAILLGERVRAGRRAVPARKILQLAPQASSSDAIHTVRKFVQSQKQAA